MIVDNGKKRCDSSIVFMLCIIGNVLYHLRLFYELMECFCCENVAMSGLVCDIVNTITVHWSIFIEYWRVFYMSLQQ